MVDEKLVQEIRSRDFLENINYFDYFKDIETKLILGSWPQEKVFLSIILPVYDHPQEFIRRAINSALNQPCSYDFRLLVIDDYAKQTTPTETELYLRELNSEKVVYYKNQKNLGVFGNWNRAIELSQSTWVTFLHSDDFLQDNFLENMARIIGEHPEIDQLCCNYKMLNFLKGNIVPNEEFKGHACTRKVHKVKACEYLHEMPTSVKGSFYKREKLIELGGFRPQDIAFGLDDYTLMLRYAHYYNTYLIDEVLYLNCWGYNDSLNTKHWFPQLISDYYMCLYFAERENFILRALYKLRARDLMIERATDFHNGTSWVGVPVEIDFEELRRICGLKSLKYNRVLRKLLRDTIKIINRFKRLPEISFMAEITENTDSYTVE